jgi:hypothetical protein
MDYSKILKFTPEEIVAKMDAIRNDNLSLTEGQLRILAIRMLYNKA